MPENREFCNKKEYLKRSRTYKVSMALQKSGSTQFGSCCPKTQKQEQSSQIQSAPINSQASGFHTMNFQLHLIGNATIHIAFSSLLGRVSGCLITLQFFTYLQPDGLCVFNSPEKVLNLESNRILHWNMDNCSNNGCWRWQ